MKPGEFYVKFVDWDHVVDQINEMRKQDQDLLDLIGRVLEATVPSITTKQAEHILNCSKEHLDNLVRSGELQLSNSKGTARYSSGQVWQCYLKGRLGHSRKDCFSLSMITKRKANAAQPI